MIKYSSQFLKLLSVLLIAAACRQPTAPPAPLLPTQVQIADALTQPPTSTHLNLPATFTPETIQIAANATLPPLKTRPPQATATPWATRTPTLPPTFTPPPTNPPNFNFNNNSNPQQPAPTNPAPPPTSKPFQPTNPPPAPTRLYPTNTPWSPPANPNPVAGANLLANGSFEGGHYNLNGVPELQLPNHWQFEWDEGHNSLDDDSWNSWVRPETRVLSTSFLPAHEHSAFVWDGKHTVKIFKEHGAISFRLKTSLFLPPGTYQLHISVFPDLIVDYTDSGQKVWAPDVLSGEVQLLANGNDSVWHLPTFGRKNSFAHNFTVAQPGNVTVGAHIRGRWAIANNGWFLDDWRLVKIR